MRVPRVLAHLRQRRQGLNPDGVRVVQEALENRGVPAVAELGEHSVRLRWQLESWPHVTIVIPTRHNRPMLSKVLPGLASTDYPSFDVRIIDNGGQSEANDAWYAAHTAGIDLQVQWWTETPFNYSRVNNVAAAGARGEVLVFLNDDIELPDPTLAARARRLGLAPGDRRRRPAAARVPTARSSTPACPRAWADSPTISSRAWSPAPIRCSARPTGTATCSR